MMDAGQFLRAIWPNEGFYVIASPYRSGNGFEHFTFQGIANAIDKALELSSSGRDAYFNCHTVRVKEGLYDPKMTDRHGTVIGGHRVRTHANALSAKCFYGDIDVGLDKPYKTRGEALQALVKFCNDCQLPKPMVVSSGGGFHVYWLISEALPSALWLENAVKLKKLAAHFSLYLDPARTTDRSSVLRVVGTQNFKNPSEPKPVRMMGLGPITPTDDFLAILDRNAVFIRQPVAAQSAETMLDHKAVSLVQVGKACQVMQELVKTAATHSEPVWHAFLGLMNFVEDGRDLAHKVSKRYPNYTPEETDEKFDRVAENQTGPTRCQRLYDLGFAETCDKCWYKAHRETSAPIVAARRMGRTYAATETIPPPPDPYRRLDVGGVALDQDGVTTVISPFDLYPSSLIADHTTGEQIMHAEWAAELPNRGVSKFRMPLRTGQDTQALSQKLADKGIVLQHDDLKHVRHYMTAYIQKLQQHMADSRQHTHLGWTDDYSEFVLPHDVYTTTGQRKPALIADATQYSVRHVTRAGTKEKQVELLKFYDHPDYVRMQFIVGCSFAAPLFYMTGQHGIIVNAQGDSGASKSTALYTAASIWGEPEGFTLNGTNSGATANARGLRLAILANLPVCFDEITYMDAEDAKNLAMSITQSQDKVRMDKDGKEKQSVAAQRSTIMISSSNGSLHEKLSTRNIAGTASSMRVFEIDCYRTSTHTKAQADDYLRGLRQNYGHLGSTFIAYVAAHQFAVQQQVISTMREIDIAGLIEPQERFWSAAIATVIVGLRIARKLGLTSYDPEAVLRWVLTEQLPAMRGMVDTNYSDPVDGLISYVNASKNDLLTVTTTNGRTGFLEKPTRELGLRYEVDTMLLTISIAHLKGYCQRRNMPLGSMLLYLEQKLGGVRTKATLGKGIADLSFGQVRCMVLNLRHEAIMGKLDLAPAAADDNVVELKRKHG